jgi:hypothetical protein
MSAISSRSRALFLATTVLAGFCWTTGVQAQDDANQTSAAREAAEREEADRRAAEMLLEGNLIIVTGSIRSSQEAALATKRELPNLADVASADSVGRFPDQNSAAALSQTVKIRSNFGPSANSFQLFER